MRFPVLHVDYFRSEITERGRFPLVEPFTERATEITDGLVALVSVEKGDEAAPDVVCASAASP